MPVKYFYLLLFFALLGNNQIRSQHARRTITGVVTCEGVRLEGVQILIKGSDYFSGTQQDGVYYIPVAAPDTVLVFSLDGYQQQEITLSDNENEYNIELKKKAPSHLKMYHPFVQQETACWLTN